MVGVEEEVDFEVGGGDFEEFVIFAVDGGGAGGFNGDGAGSELLGDEDGKGLRAALVPVVDVGEDFVLVVEIVVEDGDQWGAEGIFLLVGMRALNLQGGFGDAVDEGDAGGIGFIGLRGPVVADGDAVGLQGKIAGDFGGLAVGRLNGCGAFGDPTGAGGLDFKFFAADGLAVEDDIEFAFVGDEDGGFFVGGIQGKEEEEGKEEEAAGMSFRRLVLVGRFSVRLGRVGW